MKLIILITLVGVALCVSPQGPDHRRQRNHHYNEPSLGRSPGAPGINEPPGPPGPPSGPPGYKLRRHLRTNCFVEINICENEQSDGFGYFNGCNQCVCMGGDSACTRAACNGKYDPERCQSLVENARAELNDFIERQASSDEEEGQ